MLQKREFDSLDALLHFIAEEHPDQFAVVRDEREQDHGDTMPVWEVAFFIEPEDQPIMA